VDEVNAKLAEFIMNYPKKGIKVPLEQRSCSAALGCGAPRPEGRAVPPKVILDDEVDNEVDEEQVAIVIEQEIEKLREMLTTFLMKLPITQKEITKKEVFDELKVKNRNDKLYVLKEVIQDVCQAGYSFESEENSTRKSSKTGYER